MATRSSRQEDEVVAATRRRNEVDTKHAIARPRGRLSADEIAQLLATYCAGARGALLIGLRDQERLLTLTLPHRRNPELALGLLRSNAEQLRRLGADGFIHVHRARLVTSSEHPTPAIVIHDRISRVEGRRAYPLAPLAESAGIPIALTDRISAVLREAIPIHGSAERG